jgi:hypothetical protein
VTVVQDDAAAAAVELEPQGAAFVPLEALPAGGGRPVRAVPCNVLTKAVTNGTPQWFEPLAN